MMQTAEKSGRKTLPLILAHADADFAVQAGRQLRQYGWEVHPAATGAEARRMAHLLGPAVLAVSTELPDESGWLLCAKLVNEHPGRKVILISDQADEDADRFKAFVGATGLVDEGQGVQALVEAVQGARRRATG